MFNVSIWCVSCMFSLRKFKAIKESNIFSPEIALAERQNPQWLPWGPWAEELWRLIEPVMTVMEEYLENNLCSTNSKTFHHFQPNSICLSVTTTVYCIHLIWRRWDNIRNKNKCTWWTGTFLGWTGSIGMDRYIWPFRPILNSSTSLFSYFPRTTWKKTLIISAFKDC